MRVLSQMVMTLVLVGAAFATVPARADTAGFKAQGQFTGNRNAAYLARIFVPISPEYGESDLAVDTVFAMDRSNAKMSLSIQGATSAGPSVNQQLACDKFSVTQEKETLFASKAKETDELKNGGTSSQTVVRAECLNQKRQAYNAVVIYDEDGYTVLLSEETAASPRFDVIIGEIPKKK